MPDICYPVLIPLAGGLIALALPRPLRTARQVLSVFVPLLALYYAGWLVALVFDSGPIAGQLAPWAFSPFGLEFGPPNEGALPLIGLALRADAMSSLLVFFSCLFAALVAIYAIGYWRREESTRQFFAYLLLTLAAVNAALLADHLVFLMIAWAAATLLLFLMINLGGRPAAEGAAKTFAIVGGSDLAILFGVLILVVCDRAGGHRIALSQFLGREVSVDAGHLWTYLSFVLLAAGALAKAGAMPFHTWIPRAAEGAPAPVMAYLPASLDKLLGIYLLARVSLHVFELDDILKVGLQALGAVTIVLAVFFALLQHDLKKLLSFHAVSQVGYMVLGLGTGLGLGVVGALFHLVNNAIYKSCLFLGAGIVERRAGTTDLNRLGGLARLMPTVFTFFLIAALAIAGVPPLNGFASKWLIYQSLLEGQPLFLVAALLGSALTLASFVKVLHSVFLGPVPPPLARTQPGRFWMTTPVVFLSILCVLFGMAPSLVTEQLSFIVPELGFNWPRGAAASGHWQPLLAIILACLALIAGLGFYLLRDLPGRVRLTPSFTGGERLDEEGTRVPGGGFYDSISELPGLRVIFSDARRGVYDLYELGYRYGMVLVNRLRSLHDGILCTYMAFCLLGLGALILLFFKLFGLGLPG